MKRLRILALILFASLILLPLLNAELGEEAISAIDNRMLAKNPFALELEEGEAVDWSLAIEDYVNDRIGFRDEMILGYTLFNDRVFGQMEHPSYTYGKEGQVFGAGVNVYERYNDYHAAFADMVAAVQNYCAAKNTPFIFMFNPAKPAVMPALIADGIHYDRSWVDAFLAALDERGVRYVDTTPLLREKHEAGEQVFNQKYDAQHWNDWGAYYGTDAVLRELKKDLPGVHVNGRDELRVGAVLEESLPVSEFPIEEYTPQIELIDMEVSEPDAPYAEELERHPDYKAFYYSINEKRLAEGAPKALVFQGSYMNGRGFKYFANAFGEYVYVHDYQNILNFPYYFNIFQPDCVVFEVAEYTIREPYFDYQEMLALTLRPVPENAAGERRVSETRPLWDEELTLETGEALSKLLWQAEEGTEAAWLCLDRDYEMRATEGGYTLTLPTEALSPLPKDFYILALREGELLRYEPEGTALAPLRD